MLPRITVAFARALLLAVMTGMRHLLQEKVIDSVGKDTVVMELKTSRNRNVILWRYFTTHLPPHVCQGGHAVLVTSAVHGTPIFEPILA